MRISVGAFIPAAPFQAIASRASRRSPAGSGPTHRQTLPLGGVCVNRTSTVGTRLERQRGEVSDNIRFAQFDISRNRRFIPDRNFATIWLCFTPQEDPDYRDVLAFDFVISELNKIVRANGAAGALLDRSVLVERAVAAGLRRCPKTIASFRETSARCCSSILD